MEEESLFVLIPGFGEPYWDLKVNILKNNIDVIKAYPWKSLQVRICQYSKEKELPADITNDPCVDVVQSPGLVGEFIKTHGQAPVGTTHTMIVLDDIEIIKETFDWRKVINWLDTYHFHVLSPAMTIDSLIEYPYMRTYPANPCQLKSTSVCELFCYIMNAHVFEKYVNEIVDIDNKWMWGVDMLIFLKFKLCPAIMNHVLMRHYVKGASYSSAPQHNPKKCMELYLSKHGMDAKAISETPTTFFWIWEEQLPFYKLGVVKE